MAPLTRETLKGLVKECLVEILAEGIAPGKIRPQEQAKKIQASSAPPPPKKTKSIFDQLDEAHRKSQSHLSGKILSENPVNNVVRNATNDPILQSILADTAKTTLQEQLQHEQMIPRVPTIDPSSFYSEDRSSSTNSIFSQSSSESEEPSVMSSAAAGLDIASLFGEATSNWSEVLQRSEKKRP